MIKIIKNKIPVCKDISGYKPWNELVGRCLLKPNLAFSDMTLDFQKEFKSEFKS